MQVKIFIKEIEAHTGKPFDASSNRDLLRLNGKIEAHYSDKLRKLSLIENVLRSTANEDSLYNSKTQYAKDRYRNQNN